MLNLASNLPFSSQPSTHSVPEPVVLTQVPGSFKLLYLIFFKFEGKFCWFVHLFFQDSVLLCRFVCLGTHSVDQADLELREIHLPLPPKFLD